MSININMQKNIKKTKSKYSGFMIIEVIVATSIIVIFVLVAMSVASKSIRFSHQSLRNTQASFLIEEGAEAVRIVRDNAWANISGLNTNTTYYPTFTGGSWTLSTTPVQIDNFTRTVVLLDVNRDPGTGDIDVSGTNDNGTKFVTVNVSWVEGGETITRTLSFYILDIFS